MRCHSVLVYLQVREHLEAQSLRFTSLLPPPRPPLLVTSGAAYDEWTIANAPALRLSERVVSELMLVNDGKTMSQLHSPPLTHLNHDHPHLMISATISRLPRPFR